MDNPSPLHGIRKRPSMYIGDTTSRGLHQIFNELLDNSIDQFLAGKATTVQTKISGSQLEFSDDGPGLPFDQDHESGQSMALRYLTELRCHTPTADGHAPHVHIGGWGCGLRIVTALSESCVVTSSKNGQVWQQKFNRGIENGPPTLTNETTKNGTSYRLTIDRELFSDDWDATHIDRRLTEAAYLFPGLRVKTPTLELCANRGLADWAVARAGSLPALNPGRAWWVNELFGDIHIQAALAGNTDGETQWGAFANAGTSHEQGSHLDAFKQVVGEYQLKPAIGLIHVIMQNPQFAGPTKTKLDMPEIVDPIYEALRPNLQQFAASL